MTCNFLCVLCASSVQLCVPVYILLNRKLIMRANNTLRQMRKEWTAYLFLAPGLILFAIFTLYAVGFSFYLSFREWNILEPAKPFVGLDNYRRLIADERFRGA